MQTNYQPILLESILLGVHLSCLNLPLLQVSMQLHDLSGRLAEAQELLRCEGGFSHIKVYKEPRFRDCSLYMVYAAREGP